MASYGKEQVEYDERMEDGPITERKTTDVLFCLTFLAFWAFSGFLFLSSKSNGDITKILRPSDGLHDCGVNGPTKDYPNLFFNVDMSVTTVLKAKEIMIHAVCVKECPT
jgi:hypothetical protein